MIEDAKNLSLNPKEFEEYLVDTYEENIMEHRGIHYIFRFPNGYGASIVKMYGSYGWDQDNWELAVILFEEETDTLKTTEWIVVYPKQIVSQGCTIGNQTDEDIVDLLRKIKEL